MKQVYSYDYNGKLIGVTEAELCQITEMEKISNPELESVYILPSYSTELTPPTFDSTLQECIFNGESWEIKDLPKPEEKIEEPKKVPSYKELRMAEYPSLFDYLDGVVKNDTAQIQKYIDECKAVKLKYPKP